MYLGQEGIYAVFTPTVVLSDLFVWHFQMTSLCNGITIIQLHFKTFTHNRMTWMYELFGS